MAKKKVQVKPEYKYTAIVYKEDMNDILNKAEVLGTYTGMRANKEGRYNEMEFYKIGFNYPIWKELRNAKVDIEYIDDLDNKYTLEKGRCNNKNVKVAVQDIIDAEIALAKDINEQMQLRDKYASSNGADTGIAAYVEKKTNIVPDKKAKSLIAYSKDSDLVMPFREIVNGSGSLPIFVYLHDEKSRGMDNSTVLVKECKNILTALKASGEQYIMVVPNVVTSYGYVTKVDGRTVQFDNSLNLLLRQVIDYEIKENGGDPKRVYIMGNGSGVGDALSEITLNSKTYAGAIFTFGIGYYNYNVMDPFKGVAYELASARLDTVYADEDISNLNEDLKSINATVNYAELPGDVATATKAFYKDITWLKNIFATTKSGVTANAPTPTPKKEEKVEPIAPAEEKAEDKAEEKVDDVAKEATAEDKE